MARLLQCTRLHDGLVGGLAASGYSPRECSGSSTRTASSCRPSPILHFVRRRPETYWLWIILMFGGVGALIYIVVEVLPDAGLLRGTFQVFPRRKRIKQLEGLVLDNPSVGNYEELGDLLSRRRAVRAGARVLRQGACARASRSIPFYRRALCELALNDFAAAAADLERVVARDPKYDYQRAAGLRAHVLAKIGQREKADALFAETLQTSTLSETQYNYACFLAAEGRGAKPANGRSGSFGRRRRCPTTSAGASGRGSERRKALLKRLR